MKGVLKIVNITLFLYDKKSGHMVRLQLNLKSDFT